MALAELCGVAKSFGEHVALRGLDLTVDFEPGETIHSEISRKFTREHMADAFADAGFSAVQSWTDPKEWYAVSLFRKD